MKIRSLHCSVIRYAYYKSKPNTQSQNNNKTESKLHRVNS